MSTNLLFMCPHAAGKSLLAATYFRAAAVRNGLDVSISLAGTDPDETNMPNVTDALLRQGFTISWEPKRVTEHDTAAADIIINIGCDVGEIPAGAQVTNWDVPMLSADFDAAVRAIHRKAEDLADTLSD